MNWKVSIKKKQLKKLDKLPSKVKEIFLALETDLIFNGPEQPT